MLKTMLSPNLRPSRGEENLNCVGGKGLLSSSNIHFFNAKTAVHIIHLHHKLICNFILCYVSDFMARCIIMYYLSTYLSRTCIKC